MALLYNPTPSERCPRCGVEMRSGYPYVAPLSGEVKTQWQCGSEGVYGKFWQSPDCMRKQIARLTAEKSQRDARIASLEAANELPTLLDELAALRAAGERLCQDVLDVLNLKRPSRYLEMALDAYKSATGTTGSDNQQTQSKGE